MLLEIYTSSNVYMYSVRDLYLRAADTTVTNVVE